MSEPGRRNRGGSAASTSASGRRLLGLGGFFAYGLGLSALYVTTGAGFPCPFRLVTGWSCPLCGGTRAGAALLHGELGAAVAANPVVVLGLGVLTLLGLAWVVQLLGGPVLAVPRLRTWSARVRPNQWLVAGLVVATSFVLVRNLL